MEIFKKYKLLLPLLICLAITLVLGVILLLPMSEADPGEGRETDTQTESETEECPDMTLEFATDLSAYEDYMNPEAGSFLLLVNKTHPLASTYEPTDTVKVKDVRQNETRNLLLDRTAEMALEAMFIEMRAAGFKNVFVTSAHRSYEYQYRLFFETYLPQEMAANPFLSREEAIEKVLRYSAYPGTSEHQTGLCVDLMTHNMSDLDESFADEPVYAWLLENAWKFGFILRFPEDKTEITGYDFEPWHYRFVGRADAYAIASRGLCLEEYLADK